MYKETLKEEIMENVEYYIAIFKFELFNESCESYVYKQ